MNPILLAGGLGLYLIVINMITWQLFFAGKRRAEQGRDRIPERTLLWCAAIGGSPGAKYAQRRVRHKTRKQPFKIYLNLILVAQVLAVAMLAIPELRVAAIEAIGSSVSTLVQTAR